MAVATSAPESSRGARATQRFGSIVVVGGGCYGGYYVRQLGRAERAGTVSWRELVVVDRDSVCAVARLPPAEHPSRLRIVTSDWREFFASYLLRATEGASAADDAIVPS